jgi:hypothetical protein
MHIEMEGVEHLRKLLDNIKAEIETKYKDDEENKSFELEKFSNSALLLGKLWMHLSDAFVSESDWRIMRDTDVTDSMICVISFVNEFDPNKGYSPDDMPDDSATMVYSPEDNIFEFLVGTVSVYRIHVVGFNSYKWETNAEANINNDTFKIVTECVNNAISDTDRDLAKLDDPTVAINIGDEAFGKILVNFVETGEPEVTLLPLDARDRFAKIIERVSSCIFNYMGHYSQWIQVTEPLAGDRYVIIFIKDDDSSFSVNLANMPDTMVVLTASFKHSYLEVDIGMNKVTKLIVGPNSYKHESPDYEVRDHEWCNDLCQIVRDAVQFVLNG